MSAMSPDSPTTIPYPSTKEELDEIVRKQLTLPLVKLIKRRDMIRRTWAEWFDVTAVSFSQKGTFIITDNDEVYGIGNNSKQANILGLTGRYYRCEQVNDFVKVEKLSGKNIQELRVGNVIGAALDAEGKLYWWGQDLINEDDVRLPQLASDKLKFKNASCGFTMMAALDLDGRVYVWGRHSQKGCLHIMKLLEVGETILNLSCGGGHLAMASATGAVYTWGIGHSGQRGYSEKLAWNPNEYDLVKKMSLDFPCKKVFCGPEATICWTTDGEVWACGLNSTGQGVPGVPNEYFNDYLPKKVELSGQIISAYTLWGSYETSEYCALTTEGTYTWGGPYVEKLDSNETLANRLRYWHSLHDSMVFIDHNCTSTDSNSKFLCDTTDEIPISSDLSSRLLTKCDQINTHLQTIKTQIRVMANSHLYSPEMVGP